MTEEPQHGFHNPILPKHQPWVLDLAEQKLFHLLPQAINLKQVDASEDWRMLCSTDKLFRTAIHSQ